MALLRQHPYYENSIMEYTGEDIISRVYYADCCLRSGVPVSSLPSHILSPLTSGDKLSRHRLHPSTSQTSSGGITFSLKTVMVGVVVVG
ncbi:hypothetical protein O3P69_020275 [Scylla paramamosain]|uniref:Uncharacterized protein n=1 Tax=Scylla paramamosain TaxID=85552 RepID=A0AAW0TLM1_SCYPA